MSASSRKLRHSIVHPNHIVSRIRATMDSTHHHLLTLFSLSSHRAVLSTYPSLNQPIPSRMTYLAIHSALAVAPPDVKLATALFSSLGEDDRSTLDGRAVQALIAYIREMSSNTGDDGETTSALEEQVDELEMILAELGGEGLEEGAEGRSVRAVVGTVYILESIRSGLDAESQAARRNEAVEVLKEGVELGNDQDCLTILTHLYLTLSLAPTALTLLSSPAVKEFLSDSLLSQLLQARTLLMLGPTSKYQEAFYTFEEIKGMSGARSESAMNGVGVAQAALGRWSESGSAIEEGLALDTNNATSLANFVAVGLHNGKSPQVIEEHYVLLKEKHPTHSLVRNMIHKGEEFDRLTANYGLGRV